MLLLLRTRATQPTPPMPVTLRNKTWVINNITKRAPTGKRTYAWWLKFFQTVMKDNWDNS